MIGVVIATMLEAKPFISGLGLKQSARQPFVVYRAEEIALIISGIGKVNAAIATTHLIAEYAPDTLCNLGAAGALDSSLNLGECLHVERVVEPERLHLRTFEPLVHAAAPVAGFSGTTLATVDRVVHESADRDALKRYAQIVDMEGAGVLQASTRFGKTCTLFKFISDTRQKDDIVENIAQLRDRFRDFFIQEVLIKLEPIVAPGSRRLTTDPIIS